MYLLEPNAELNLDYLGKCLISFQTKDLPILNRYKKYWDGKQRILQKVQQEGKPCNRTVINYCKEIVDNYKGYICGVPVTYDGENLDELIDILRYNDVDSEDSDLLEDALVYGVAYEICYIDENSKQRFRSFDPRQCVPIYDNTLENDLLYLVRFYREDLLDKSNENYIVEVYSRDSIKYYRSSMGFVSFELINEEPHYYGQVPITVFKLNREQKSIFDQIMSLQDAYNNLMSDAQDTEDAFADCYMVLKGVTADEEELSKMKTNKILMMDTDASAEYLTKDINNQQFSSLQDIYDDQIYRKAGCPNFTDEKFFASSGIALRFRLLQFENKASGIVNQMTKALQRRLELLCGVLNLTGSEYIWRDVDIRFTRNIPDQLVPSTAQEVITYKGTVSEHTLLGLLPFVENVDEEEKLLEEERQAGMELFRSNLTEEDEDE